MRKYSMHYISGSGMEYDGGVWEVRKTPKTTILKLLEQSLFPSNCPELMRVKSDNERSHRLIDWDDDTFTIYPFQSGTPHIFEPFTEAEL